MEQAKNDVLRRELMEVLEENCKLLGLKHPLEYGTYRNLWGVMVEKLPMDIVKDLDEMMGDDYKHDDILRYMHRKVRERLGVIH